MASFISKLITKQVLKALPNMSIDQAMHKAIFQLTGNNSVIYPDDKQSYITNGYNANLFVYSIINYITKKGSVIPWVVKEKLPNGKERIVENHDIYKVFKEPNGLYSWQEFLEQSMGYLLLTGDTMTYTLRVGANRERVQEVYYLPTQYMEIVASGNFMNPIKEYQFSMYKDVKYKSEEILHTKLPNYDWDNGQSLYGMSPLKAGLRNLEMSNENITAMKSQSANQGARGLLMFDGANGTSTITEPQMRAFELEMRRKVNKGDKRGTVQLLDRMFKYQQLGMSSKDLELIANHNISKDDLCTLYGLNSILFNNQQSASYNNLKEARQSAYTDAIIPLLQRILDDWNYNIIRPQNENQYLALDLSNIPELQEDLKEKSEWVSKCWWMGTKWKTEQMGGEYDGTLAPYYIPTNLIPSDEVDINNAFNDYQQSQT